jgi:hypothetical protein
MMTGTSGRAAFAFGNSSRHSPERIFDADGDRAWDDNA